MEPAPTETTDDGNDLKKLNFNEIVSNKEKNFQLAVDYYTKDNPFKKVIIGSTIGVVGSYSAAIVALGVSGAYISGGVLFYDTAYVVGGYGALAGTLGLIIGVPAILGGVGYSIYKVVKSKQMKKYMNKISDLKDESAAEEREILSLLTKECLDYFKNYIMSSYNDKLKEVIVEDTNEILKMFRADIINQNQAIVDKIKDEINEMNFINIILIGSTGVGKSTLINEFLKLKENQAKEGNTAEPQKIENWPKKYPVSEKDTNIVGINLYDTEGIEKTGDNNFKAHLSRIIDFINSPTSHLKNKINAIWYCINSNRLDGDEEYINSILELFTNLKIPMVFIFTKAYESRLKDIEVVKNGLKNFKYFKENPDELHFIEVIAKDLYSERSGKLLEGKLGLDELLKVTKNISNNTIMAPIVKKISDELNNKYSQRIIEDLSKKLQEQYDDFICKHDKIKTFKKKLYDIFKTIYVNVNDSTKNLIEKKIESWIKILEKIEKEDLKKAIKNYDKKYLINKVEKDVKKKYDEKISKNEGLPEDRKFTKTYKEYKTEIEDYLITQINNSKDIYALYSLFDIARDSIIEIIFKDLEIELNKQKIEVTKKLENVIHQKILEFAKKLMN